MSYLYKKMRILFSIDLRTLALLRVCTALLLLIDLINRFPDIQVFYTDSGVLPRNAFSSNPALSGWSLHLLSGEWYFQAFLFLTAGIFAVLLLLGYKTKLSTVFCLIFLLSLHVRNRIIIEGGDMILRFILYWCLFLPWGARYSLDYALNKSYQKLPQRFVSFGTAGLLLQVAFVYIFSFFHKTGTEWKTEGSAIYYALNIDQLATSFGHFLLSFPSLLTFFTHAVVSFELIGPLLLFSPFFTEKIRIKTIPFFILLHIGFGISLMIGLFPLISIVSILAFIPSLFWDRLFSWLKTPQRLGLKIYYDNDCSFCRKVVTCIKTFFLLPETTARSAQAYPSILSQMNTHNSWIIVDWKGNQYSGFRATLPIVHASPILFLLLPFFKLSIIMWLGEAVYKFIASHRKTACALSPAPKESRSFSFQSSYTANILAGIFLIFILIWNIGTLFPSYIRLQQNPIVKLGLTLGLYQHWSMFSPSPLKHDGWYVISGVLKDGTHVDLFRNGKSVNWHKPKNIQKEYESYRKAKYFINLHGRYTQYRIFYAQYLCREWNFHHEDLKRLGKLTIYYMLEYTLPNYQQPTIQKETLLEHECE